MFKAARSICLFLISISTLLPCVVIAQGNISTITVKRADDSILGYIKINKYYLNKELKQRILSKYGKQIGLVCNIRILHNKDFLDDNERVGDSKSVRIVTIAPPFGYNRHQCHEGYAEPKL